MIQVISITDIVTETGLERKRKNLGVTRDGKVGDKPLTKIRFPGVLSAPAYEWCQEQFKDNWIWSRNPNNSEWCEIFFLNTIDALAFKLKFATA
jgi:hypothetical protein